jgi:hypothetical protein
MANRKKDKAIIKYKGNEYELVFNLNVMEEIQEEYGSIEAWSNLTDAESEPNMKAVIFGLTAMINEGIEIYNEDHDEDRKTLNHKQVGRMISEVGLVEASEQINKTVINSTKSDEKN